MDAPRLGRSRRPVRPAASPAPPCALSQVGRCAAANQVSTFTEPVGSTMRLMRMRGAVLVVPVAVGVMATGCVSGCSHLSSAADSSSPPGSSTNATRTANSTSTTAKRLSSKDICHRALGSAVVLAWAPGTVAEFRSYQYGGPRPTVPLAHAFPGVPAGTPGAWCATKQGQQATRWWAALVGRRAASVITVHGPGEGVRLGAVSGPVQPP
jgi:hypothetical protein